MLLTFLFSSSCPLSLEFVDRPTAKGDELYTSTPVLVIRAQAMATELWAVVNTDLLILIYPVILSEWGELPYAEQRAAENKLVELIFGE